MELKFGALHNPMQRCQCLATLGNACFFKQFLCLAVRSRCHCGTLAHQIAQLSSVVVQKLGKRYNASFMYNLYISHAAQTYILQAVHEVLHSPPYLPRQWPFSLTVAAARKVD